MTEITYHLAEIRERVSVALEGAGRGGEHVMIVAVSKQQTADAIRAAHAAGQTRFGESYVQEALPKISALRDLPLEWHFVGPVQANKTRAIAESFQWVHSVDRAKIARRLHAQRPFHAPPLNVLIQVNLAAETSKRGTRAGEIPALAALIGELTRLRLRGLMGIAPARAEAGEAARYFGGLRELQRDLETAGIVTDTLSMGMSGDFEIALANGSTCVRIGAAIFGARHG